MIKKSKHINREPDTSYIDRHAKGESFKTPENYFEDFSSKIVSMTEDMPAEPPRRSVYQKMISRPWTMAAAAASIVGLVLLSVFYSGENPQKQIDDQQHQQGLVHADSNQTEDEQKTYDSSQKVIAKQNKKDTNHLAKKEPAKTAKHKPDTLNTGKSTTKEPPVAQKTEKDKVSDDAQETKSNNYSTNDSDNQYAQTYLQNQGNNKSESISQQGGSAGNTTDEEVSIASAKVSQELKFYNDTCISSPTWFDLPSVPGKYEISWANTKDKDSILIDEGDTYTAFLINPEGDTISSPDFDVRYLPEPEVKLRRQYKVCINKNLKLDPGFYDKKYEFQWSDGVESPVNFVSEISGETKTYTLKIKGCKTYEYQTIVVFEPCKLKIPNVITPNGDGVNDCFKIEGLENYPGSKLIIVDRKGKELYKDENYQNDYNGNNLPEGSYFYILKVNDKHQTTKKGNLNIIY